MFNKHGENIKKELISLKKAFKISALLLLVILVVTAFAMPASAKQVFTDLSPEHWCYSKIIDFEKKDQL